MGHCVGVFTISTATYAYLSIHKKHRNLSEFQKRLISFSAGMFVGVLKEIGDSMEPNNRFCWKDMQANALGGVSFSSSCYDSFKLQEKEQKKMGHCREYALILSKIVSFLFLGRIKIKTINLK